MHNVFDIACNFTSERCDNDLDEVIERAIENNITKFGLICSCMDDFPKLINIYNNYSDSFNFTIGIHPHHANELNENNLVKLKDLVVSNSPHAVGETGLDFFRTHRLDVDQKKIHQQSMMFSNKLKKCINYHTS